MDYLKQARHEVEQAQGLLNAAKSELVTIKGELRALKDGDCSVEVKKALELYKRKKLVKKAIKEAEIDHLSATGQLQGEEEDMKPQGAFGGGRRSRSRTQKKNRRSKKSRKC